MMIFHELEFTEADGSTWRYVFSYGGIEKSMLPLAAELPKVEKSPQRRWFWQ